MSFLGEQKKAGNFSCNQQQTPNLRGHKSQIYLIKIIMKKHHARHPNLEGEEPKSPEFHTAGGIPESLMSLGELVGFLFPLFQAGMIFPSCESRVDFVTFSSWV